jgi:virginiamycin B lyase
MVMRGGNGSRIVKRVPRLESLEARQLLAAPPVNVPPLSLDISAHAGGIATGSDGALWFTQSGVGRIGRVATNGAISEFPIPGGSETGLGEIVAGSDGALWFTEFRSGDAAIGRITTAGAFSEFPLPAHTTAVSLAAGPDGNLWISEERADPATSLSTGLIGKLSPAGALVEFALPTPLFHIPGTPLPGAITAGPDGALWFLENTPGSLLGRITTDGKFTEFTGPNNSSLSWNAALTTGPDGNLWVTFSTLIGAGIQRVTTAGVVIGSFDLPNLGSNYSGIGAAGTGVLAPSHMTSGPDGNVWFSELYKDRTGRVGRITPNGVVTEFPLPAGTGFPGPITAGPDGALWYVSSNDSGAGLVGVEKLAVGRITTTGAAIDEPVPPAQLPVVGRLDPRSDHGASSIDGVTNDRTPTFFGLAQPGATVTLTAAAPGAQGRTIQLGRVKASRNGAWSVTSRALADGSYQVLMATSGRGITPSAGTPPLTRFSTAGPLVIDTVAPRIVGSTYTPTTREVSVTVQDVGGGIFTPVNGPRNGPIAVLPTVTKKGTRGALGLTMIPTSVSLSAPTIPPEQPLVFSGVIQDPAPAAGVRYTIRIKAAGLPDLAGNSLDGEFRGRYPTGNRRPGGDFVITVG